MKRNMGLALRVSVTLTQHGYNYILDIGEFRMKRNMRVLPSSLVVWQAVDRHWLSGSKPGTSESGAGSL